MRTEELDARRHDAERAWTSHIGRDGDDGAAVRPEILNSWSRAGAVVPTDLAAAPLDDEGDAEAYWRDSPLQVAVRSVEEELRRTAEDGDLVLAVTDPETRILWTYGGRAMRRQAESVNFVPGARWDEQSTGTNALDLANRLRRPQMVFGAEHYAPIVHNWVCWAAPVVDPSTGDALGVIDLSTSWNRSHPIGMATARVLARLIEAALPATGPVAGRSAGEPGAGLVLSLLGRAEARLDGHRMLLTRRQTEVLALLALHPEGLTLDQLHALLYGDRSVSPSTLKVEVSRVRAALGGMLATRPYRLTLPVTTDVERVLDLLRHGQVSAAVECYGGDLLPGTDSPALVDLGEYLAVAVREALLAQPDPGAVVRYSDRVPHDVEVLEACLALWGHRDHPAVPLVRGRLASALR